MTLDYVKKKSCILPCMQGRPQSLLRNLITPCNLQLIQSLQKLHQRLQTPIRQITAPQRQTEERLRRVGKTLNEIKDVGVISMQQDQSFESPGLDGLEEVDFDLPLFFVVVRPLTHDFAMKHWTHLAPKVGCVEDVAPFGAHLR